MKRRTLVTLDSGAFSAHTRGIVIKLRDYIGFLERHHHRLDSYVNLDVIASGEDGAKLGWKNYETIRGAGLHPIPVYHVGERLYWLERMLGEGADHIGLGGLVGTHRRERTAWLRQVFGILSTRPPVKTHMFGVGASDSLFKFPAYSVDSVTWTKAAGSGQLLYPPSGDMTRAPIQILVAKSKEGGSTGRTDHIDTFGGDGLRYALGSFYGPLGFTFEQLRDSSECRCRAMIRYLSKLSGMGMSGASPRPSGLFTRDAVFEMKTLPRVIFGAGGWSAARLLMSEGVRRILVSYAYVSKEPEWFEELLNAKVVSRG